MFPTFVEVYNLEIEDNENHYVTEEGVLVHNGYKDKQKNLLILRNGRKKVER
ncbi:hypothetical protein [Prevotella melaninogenica]|uniref:hypothetical protein n=1 Tax=Prevotella melaninogenica TaxID=28132 RepID=UPI00356B6C06